MIDILPRHQEDANSYTLRVITNKRSDGKTQYKITLPKPLGDMAGAIDDSIVGEFFLSKIRCGDEELDLYMSMFLFNNPSESDQELLIRANWQALTCPYCGKSAEPPLFPKGAEPISHKLVHVCGATYYVDRSDRRSMREWSDIQERSPGDWRIVHNYHIQIGKVGTNLPEDFDIDLHDSRLNHVIFVKRD